MFVSTFVMIPGPGVVWAIDLNSQFLRRAEEVEDEWSDGVLGAETQAVEPFVAQGRPEDRFLSGHRTAHALGAFYQLRRRASNPARSIDVRVQSTP